MWKILLELGGEALDLILAVPEKDRQKAIDVYRRKHQEARDAIKSFKSDTDADLAAGKAELDALKR